MKPFKNYKTKYDNSITLKIINLKERNIYIFLYNLKNLRNMSSWKVSEHLRSSTASRHQIYQNKIFNTSPSVLTMILNSLHTFGPITYLLDQHKSVASVVMCMTNVGYSWLPTHSQISLDDVSQEK